MYLVNIGILIHKPDEANEVHVTNLPKNSGLGVDTLGNDPHRLVVWSSGVTQAYWQGFHLRQGRATKKRFRKKLGFEHIQELGFQKQIPPPSMFSPLMHQESGLNSTQHQKWVSTINPSEHPKTESSHPIIWQNPRKMVSIIPNSLTEMSRPSWKTLFRVGCSRLVTTVRGPETPVVQWWMWWMSLNVLGELLWRWWKSNHEQVKRCSKLILF